MITLVDTSIWIELFRGKIHAKIDEFLRLGVCPPIIQEVLQGFGNQEKYEILKSGILAMHCLSPSMKLDTYLLAADLYRTGRRRGFAIRSGTDCLIAAVALENDAEVLHKDRDYEYISKFSRLKTRSLI